VKEARNFIREEEKGGKSYFAIVIVGLKDGGGVTASLEQTKVEVVLVALDFAGVNVLQRGLIADDVRLHHVFQEEVNVSD